MNIFQSSVEIKKTADAKNSSAGITSPDKIKLPYFKGNMKVKGEGQPFLIKKENLTTSFLISYYTCLAACIVKTENQSIATFNKTAKKADKKERVVLSIYVIEAVFSYEGYLHSDYSTKTAKGYKRIKAHLIAVSDREGLNLSIDDEGTITGMTDKIVSAVLSAV